MLCSPLFTRLCAPKESPAGGVSGWFIESRETQFSARDLSLVPLTRGTPLQAGSASIDSQRSVPRSAAPPASVLSLSVRPDAAGLPHAKEARFRALNRRRDPGISDSGALPGARRAMRPQTTAMCTAAALVRPARAPLPPGTMRSPEPSVNVSLKPASSGYLSSGGRQPGHASDRFAAPARPLSHERGPTSWTLQVGPRRTAAMGLAQRLGPSHRSRSLCLFSTLSTWPAATRDHA